MRRDINIIMKISIIVPVYNAEKTIEYCIDSIIAQKTKFEIELILVEDYSTDRSYEICLALKKKYTEIKLYRTNGKGCISGQKYWFITQYWGCCRIL